jgi:hypothetical protein
VRVHSVLNEERQRQEAKEARTRADELTQEVPWHQIVATGARTSAHAPTHNTVHNTVPRLGGYLTAAWDGVGLLRQLEGVRRMLQAKDAVLQESQAAYSELESKTGAQRASCHGRPKG